MKSFASRMITKDVSARATKGAVLNLRRAYQSRFILFACWRTQGACGAMLCGLPYAAPQVVLDDISGPCTMRFLA
jgi:hypothetical protein